MDFPKGGIIGKTVNLARRLVRMDISSHAANAGYFILMSVFPALLLILSLLRYTTLDAQDLLALLEGFLPQALMDWVERIVISTYAHTSTAVISVSAVGTLWSASRGIYGLMTGLNEIYDVPESRGYFQTRLVCMVYTFLFLVVLLVTLVLGVFGDGLLQLLPPASGGLGLLLTEVLDLRFFLMLFLQTGLFTAMFMVLPNRHNGFRESLPGAVLASAGWLIFTQLFSVYVEHFGGYNNIYGSIYALALSMLWLYCCMSIVFFGGALNVILGEKR